MIVKVWFSPLGRAVLIFSGVAHLMWPSANKSEKQRPGDFIPRRSISTQLRGREFVEERLIRNKPLDVLHEDIPDAR